MQFTQGQFQSGYHSAEPRRVRLFGRTNSADAYIIRDFLARSVVHFEWIELVTDDDCRTYLGAGSLDTAGLPVVELPDGERLSDPSVRQIADRLGWVTKPRRREYDLSIYGAGPAGLSAAVYAASEGLSVVVVERNAIGGQAGSSSMIENYMGFPAGIAGAELAERARQQAVKFGAEFLLMREGIRGSFHDDRIWVDLADGGSLVARANICATGVNWRTLGIDRETDFLDNGLFYGAGTSEAPQCAGADVIIVGGGNSAGQAVLNLAEFAASVTMVIRGPNLAATMSSYLAIRILATSNITILYNTEVTAVDGDETLRSVRLTDRLSGIEVWRDDARLFVCIGGAPDTEWAKDTAILRDRSGFLITGPDLGAAGQPPAGWPLDRDPFYLETSVPGSFAAGDVRHNSIKRVAAAVGEGAMAVTFAHRYLAETESTPPLSPAPPPAPASGSAGTAATASTS